MLSFRKIIPPFLKRKIIDFNNRYFDGYAVKSYSQEGEDLVLRRFFECEKGGAGFYVDVGAHHPYRFSNTYLFYRQGWRGVNIDATPGSMSLFNKLRPRDLNLEYAVSDAKGAMPYFIFLEPALNTFANDLANEYIAGGQPLLRKEIIELYPLSEILDKHLKANSKIDFMTVDAEGFDLRVLKSNNWDKYRPDVLLVESLDFDLNSSGSSEVYQYMAGVGYNIFAKTINTLFFKRMH